MDKFVKAKRSWIMSRISGKGNKETELVLARLFRQNQIIGWRRHQPYFGKPDFAFRREKLLVFVDGCFWHMCPKHSSLPSSNRAFWKKKLNSNLLRDRLVSQTLRKSGWKVVRIWEHELTKNPNGCIRRIRAALASAD